MRSATTRPRPSRTPPKRRPQAGGDGREARTTGPVNIGLQERVAAVARLWTRGLASFRTELQVASAEQATVNLFRVGCRRAVAGVCRSPASRCPLLSLGHE